MPLAGAAVGSAPAAYATAWPSSSTRIRTSSRVISPLRTRISSRPTLAPRPIGLSPQVALTNLTDGQWHNVVVHWSAATQTFTYTYGGVQVGQLQLTPAQFASYFGGSNYAYFGFTGSTGGSSALHQIQVNSLNATFETGSPPGTPHPHDGSIFDVTTIDQHVTVNGSASDQAATHTFTLTPDAQNKTGGVTLNDKVDLTHDFNIAFELYFGPKQAADGMAFVLHNDPNGATAIGGWRQRSRRHGPAERSSH